MKKRFLGKRWLCVGLCGAIALSGCAVPQGGGGAPGQAASTTQAGCIVGHIAMGAIAGAVLSGVLGGNSKAVARSAVAGGLAGFAGAWMRCINQFATPTTTTVVPMKPGSEPGYSPQQGAVLRVRSAYLDPGAVSPGGRSTLRVAYLVMDAGREVAVNQTVSFRFVSPDGTEQGASPKVDKVIVEPGLQQLTLPLDIPSEITDGKLIATLGLEVNGRTQTTHHEILVTGDNRRLDMARNEAAQQRAEFDRVMAGAGRRAAPEPQMVAAHDGGGAGAKSAPPAHKTLVVQIARANLREQPSARARLVGTAARGERLKIESEITGAEGRWVRVTAGNVAGWVGASAGTVD